jgi:crotonobetainyl-CoA:carnitine CoA-transferase CaiB-like acyl-CoA transferase
MHNSATVARDQHKTFGPLSNVRVLDLTSVVMGPYCTQILADLGATVIKVEAHEGDTLRYIPGGHSPDMGGTFLNLNRGKRSLCIDLKSAKGRDALLKVAAQTDVFIHSMRSQAIQRLGLSYADLLKVSPRMIYANVYGFSRRGPYADQPAYDDTIQAACGLAMLQGLMTGSPSYLATVIADKVSGLTGLYAILAALYHRAQTGEGQEIEVGMFETMASFVLVEHIGGALFDPPLGAPVYQRVVSPMRRPYKTADGYISTLIYTDKQWQAFLEIVGNPDWGRDPRFTTLKLRSEHIDEVYERVGASFVARSTADWIEKLQGAGIPAMPVLTTEQLMSDEHLHHVGFFERVNTKDGVVRFPGIPTWFSKTPGQITHSGPALGEHSVETLLEAGLTKAEIEDLLSTGILRDGRKSMPEVIE